MRLTGPLTACYVAAPSYFAAFGRPAHPRDLLNHRSVRYKYITANRIHEWQFVEDGQTKTVDPPRRLIFDSMDAVRQAVRDGQGIGWSLRKIVQDDLKDGTLETVLDSYVTEMPPFYLYYPEQNRRLELLRLFIDFLTAKRSGSKPAGRKAKKA